MAEIVILDDFGEELLRYVVPEGAEGLVGAVLEGAYLQGAQLAGANLKGAGANLLNADLSRDNLDSGTSLEGANLRGTDLRWTKLTGATYDESTVFPEGFDPAKAGMRLTGPTAPSQKRRRRRAT